MLFHDTLSAVGGLQNISTSINSTIRESKSLLTLLLEQTPVVVD